MKLKRNIAEISTESFQSISPSRKIQKVRGVLTIDSISQHARVEIRLCVRAVSFYLYFSTRSFRTIERRFEMEIHLDSFRFGPLDVRF
ncbi:hypothetical protein TNCT_269631 [Trichonephila clavata]|uniref:Uncharacterized protein n=1 Tax=Trichonephila clavata TaxID=2740835 RepID=A0A8X6IUK4_TRICU|nr:hypothetical protein TNCT_269631 [Trichonephila clavata]